MTRVTCSIYTPDGQLLEAGEAIQLDNEDYWAYTTTNENAHLPGTTFRFSAFDIPKNETALSITL